MDSMLQHSTCQHFGTDCKDLIPMINESQAWPTLLTDLNEIQKLKRRFNDFRISYILREHNETAHFLARISRSFHKALCFVGYSVMV